MFIPIYRKSNHINVHLTTPDTDIQNLIDEILDEISSIKKISNRSRAREALKKVILNLIHAERTKDCVRISRNKNDYGHHRMYGQIWLKYDRLIPIIDGLIELGYVEHLNGYWDKEKKTGYQTKIWASDRLRSRFFIVPSTHNPKSIERAEPEQLIQLKDSSKKLVSYTPTRPITLTKKRLSQYNDFIQGQHITVNLTEEVATDNEFWCHNLLNGLLNASYTLAGLKLNQELNITDTISRHCHVIYKHSEDNTNPKYILVPCSVPSTSSSTITSTHTPTPPSINTTNSTSSSSTSTLLSHIQTLIHLSSTKEKQPKPLIDKALMISNDELMEYFLNWLLFLNTGIKRGWDDKQIRQAYRSRSRLGKLGIAELVFRLKYEACHRVFNNSSFKNGGRFYGASHLDIPGHMRGFIRINGEPVVELDYDALHVVMLYHLRGIDIDLAQDPYDMIVGPEDRSIKKIALLTAINAPTEAKAIKGIRKALVDDGITGDILTDKALRSLIARAKLAHPDISDDVASGKGIELQNLDSRIADAILTNLMAENIPALPVHDSFIVPQKYEDLLRQQMLEEYEKILGFKPGVSKKEKRYFPKKWKNWN
ncbi:hypothetical protein [Desulfobacter postgatei]|uniref:hypothetical protein n=1 Tax=Desulfobacter postgatei TaxID=2293 RepID=UPI002A36D796|nr:hypothetical protein [Desulfobacter postgatei]MDX9964486.1 hypothetical protein [Desulfobacter postgatei]